MKVTSYNKKEYDQYLYEIRGLTRKLGRISSALVGLFIVSLASFFITIVFKFTESSYWGINKYSIDALIGFTTTLVACLLGIFVLFLFDQTRRKGLVIYDVTGDYIEKSRLSNRHINQKIDDELVINDRRYQGNMMRTQYLLQDFFHATDLPIVPGSIGQALYFTMFVALAIMSAVILFI